MSPVNIPTGSSAVLTGVSTFYSVPSDKHLNFYTTVPRLIPSTFFQIHLSSLVLYFELQLQSGSASQNKPHKVNTTYSHSSTPWGAHTKPTAFNRFPEMSNKKGDGTSVSDCLYIRRAFLIGLLLTQRSRLISTGKWP